MNQTPHCRRAPQAFPVARSAASGFWPTPQHEALLRAALMEPPRLGAALDEWREFTSVEQLDYPSLTIIPMLYRNLLRHGASPDLRERLHGTYRWSWHRNQLLLAALQEALAELRRSGVEVLLMKGVPLALCHYADMGARVMGDADVVVRRIDIARALKALAEAGWKAEQALSDRVLASLGGVNLRNPRGLCIDLNWHVLPDHYDFRLDEALWEAGVTINVGRESVRCLEPTDHLLEVIGHGLSWSANAPLHWVADAMVLLRSETASIRWERLIDQANRHQRVHTVRTALRYLTTVFDAPVPAPVLAELDRLQVARGERIAFWFAQRSGPTWPWGRAPLVAASYVRSSRARGRLPGIVDFLHFLGARAACTPAESLRRAGVDVWRHVRGSCAIAARRLLGGSGQVRA